ncbi:MAG: arsenate reductase ArsC [Brevinematales bacterium]
MVRVLFVCVHNSARSQMAEAFLNHWGKGHFIAESGGIKPGTLNPLAIQVMAEKGIDISQQRPKAVFDLYKEGRKYDYVITVCEKEAAERCPIFPGRNIRIEWSFPNPASLTGTEQEKLEKMRQIRDDIERHVLAFIESEGFSPSES